MERSTKKVFNNYNQLLIGSFIRWKKISKQSQQKSIELLQEMCQ